MTTMVAPRAATRLSWPAVLALHLLPAAATFAAALALRPVMRGLNLPPQFGLTLASALVLAPIELGLLLRAAGWSRAALPTVLSFKRRPPLRLYLTVLPCLAAMAFGVVILLAPLEQRVLGVSPAAWLLPPDPAAFPVATLVTTLLIALVVDGLARPAIEELYFRAYLLPRLPVRGALAAVTSAGLYAAQYPGPPERLLFVFVAQLLLIAVMLRVRSVRISIAAHCLASSTAILLTLAAVLS